MEREVGGGIRMGNTCKPMADSFQCMTKPTTIKKKKKRTVSLSATVGLVNISSIGYESQSVSRPVSLVADAKAWVSYVYISPFQGDTSNLVLLSEQNGGRRLEMSARFLSLLACSQA